MGTILEWNCGRSAPRLKCPNARLEPFAYRGRMAAISDIQRHFDANFLNALANHPAIRPSCGGDGRSPLDFAAFASNPKNHAIVWAHGAFLFHWSAPQTYEVHIMVLPEGRGKDAYRMAEAGIAYITQIGAERLWARVAADNHALRHYTSSAGFERCGMDVLDIGFGPVEYDLYQWKKPCLQR